MGPVGPGGQFLGTVHSQAHFQGAFFMSELFDNNSVDLSENGQAMDAIREVGPGKHFLGCAHTQANFETAFYRSPIADNNSVEQWLADGAKNADASRPMARTSAPIATCCRERS